MCTYTCTCSLVSSHTWSRSACCSLCCQGTLPWRWRQTSTPRKKIWCSTRSTSRSTTTSGTQMPRPAHGVIKIWLPMLSSHLQYENRQCYNTPRDWSRRQVWIKHRHIRHWYHLRLSFPRLKRCWMLKCRLACSLVLETWLLSFFFSEGWVMAACHDVPEVTQSINGELRDMIASHFSNAVTSLERVEFNTLSCIIPASLKHLC